MTVLVPTGVSPKVRMILAFLVGALLCITAVPAMASAATFGKTAVGASTSGGMDINSKRASCYSASATGNVTKLSMYLSPGSASGTENLKGVIYASGPGALLGTSNQLAFANTNAAGWYDLTFPGSGVAVTSGTTYCIGWISGGTANAAFFKYDTGAHRYINVDTYSDGASNPFGTDTGGDTLETSVYATVTTQTAPSVPTGLTATPGNAQVTLNWTANGSGDNVTKYNVYRTDTSGVWGSCPGSTTCNASNTQFVNASGVTNGTQYCYQLTAVNSVGESAKTAQQCATPTGGGGGSGTYSAGQEHGLSTTVCNKYASPTGSDSNSGTLASPYATVGKLDLNLTAGQTGCLRAGTYNHGAEASLSNGAGVTITAYPGEAAVVQGWMYVTGAGTTLSYLNVDLDNATDTWAALCAGGTGTTVDHNVTYPLWIDGSNVTVKHSDVHVDSGVAQNRRGLAIGVAFSFSDSNDVIQNNRIHDVGFCPVEEHGVYVDNATNASISGNWIYNIPAGTGVQVWDHAHGTQVTSNVMEQTSSCLDIGSNTSDTTATLAQHNICANSVGLQSPWSGYCVSPGPGCTGPDPGQPLFDYWGGTPPTGANQNQYNNNDDFCKAGLTHCTTSLTGTSGVTFSGNVTSDPLFADASYQTSHDYRVSASSPAAAWGMWDGDL